MYTLLSEGIVLFLINYLPLCRGASPLAPFTTRSTRPLLLPGRPLTPSQKSLPGAPLYLRLRRRPPRQDGDGRSSKVVVVPCALERIGEGSYLNMAAHPDGSARAFFSTQEGKIWLATVPAHGSGDILRIHDEDDAIPFLDLTDRVLHMVCVALHPEFATNGRF